MDSYKTNIELEFQHWLANLVNGKTLPDDIKAALSVGYYGGRVDGATCREQYAVDIELYKEAQIELSHLLKI